MSPSNTCNFELSPTILGNVRTAGLQLIINRETPKKKVLPCDGKFHENCLAI